MVTEPTPEMIDAAMAAVASLGLRLSRDPGDGMERIPDFPDDEREYARNRNWRSFTERTEVLQSMRARKAAEAALRAALAVDPLRPADTERALDEVLAERDALEERLDRLAYAVAPQSVIGEHSSANDPWQNALDILIARQADTVPVNRELLREVREVIQGAADGRWTPGTTIAGLRVLLRRLPDPDGGA